MHVVAPPHAQAQPTPTRASLMRYGRWVVLAVLLAGIGVGIAYRDAVSLESLGQLLDRLGPWGPIGFIVIYTIGAVLFLPGSVLTLAGGALFGPWLGTLYTVAGATAGATMAFLAARYLGGDWVAQRAGGRLRTIVDGVDAQGWRFVAFTRLVPIFPFNLLNYMFGLTGIRLLHYVVASMICMVPGALAYNYLGYAGRSAAAGDADAIKTIFIAVVLVGAMAMLPLLIKRWRATRGKAEVVPTDTH